MSTQEQAASIRNSITLETVRAISDTWPQGDRIAPRENFDMAPYLAKLPKPLEARRAAAERQLESYMAAEAQDIERYNQLRTEGPAVLSDYDLVIAYQGNAIHALTGSLRLKLAHISYDRSLIFGFVKELLAIDEAIEKERPQLALF